MDKKLYESYIKNLELNDTRLNTIKSVKSDLNTLYNYIASQDIKSEIEYFKNVTLTDVQNMMRNLREKYKPSTYNRKLVNLKVFFQYIVDNTTLLDINYFNSIKQISSDIVENETKEKDIISIDNIRKILKATNQKDNEKKEKFDFNSKRNKAIITILTCYGNRIEEVLSAKFSDIKSIDNIKYINIPKIRVKNRLDKKIFIANEIEKNLNEYLKVRNSILSHNDDDYIFSSINGKKLTSNNINAALSNLCKKANIEKHITCHCFRHICTLEMQKNLVPEYLIDEIIGWKKNSMQSRYSKHLTHEKIYNIISATNLI